LFFSRKRAGVKRNLQEERLIIFKSPLNFQKSTLWLCIFRVRVKKNIENNHTNISPGNDSGNEWLDGDPTSFFGGLKNTYTP